MSKLNFYTVFHLNLAFSSIPESDLPVVIERCYWPLLRLVKKFKGVIAIEATGYTLEKINELDPRWIVELRDLLSAGATELIGSGYAQIIGPLVPFEVNVKNLEIGNEVYEEMLGVKPRIAFVNEQTYSRGLIKCYLSVGYEAIVMEWNNPRQWHPDWDNELRFSPQTISDDAGNTIRVIWNDSIAFQKFERCVRGSLEEGEYFDYLRSHVGPGVRYMSLYTSDTEVFDYRPGRYKTEIYRAKGEWAQIERIFRSIVKVREFSCVLPSMLPLASKRQSLRLESAARPIIVKKQDKYNVVRWALTGRDDIGSNTACYRIFSLLKTVKGDTRVFWKKLCYLWDSDFRTHTGEEKHKKFKGELKKLETQVALVANVDGGKEAEEKLKKIKKQKTGNSVVISTATVLAKLNERRGLTIDELIFKDISNKPLVKILPHGYYENMSFSADFYSGHTIVEAPLTPKITDLSPVVATGFKCNNASVISGDVKLNIGVIKKKIKIYNKESRLDIAYNFSFKDAAKASFRTGIITLNPEAFDSETLFYSCHNGGDSAERFELSKVDSIDIRPLSLLITAQNVLGNTTGCIEIGDAKKSIVIKNDPSQLAALPMIHFQRVGGTYFLRILYSLGEIDETSLLDKKPKKLRQSFGLTIEAKKKGK